LHEKAVELITKASNQEADSGWHSIKLFVEFGDFMNEVSG